ncbi:MAG TPA: formate dehydrogenase accessory protein FdhE [Planctomycetota bacterium]|nr:formate dehydrogenase accessory protein FdhE [Planctomycetota bacterium]
MNVPIQPPTTARPRGRWDARRRRCDQLLPRYPHAADMLSLQQALLGIQQQAFAAALADRPQPASWPAWSEQVVAPSVAEATRAHGPAELAAATQGQLQRGEAAGLAARWLAGEVLPPLLGYLPRATLQPLLEALLPPPTEPAGGDARHCPACGGLPQLWYVADGGDPLTTAPRRLLCARCGQDWVFARTACPACGESASAQRTVFADDTRFPPLSAAACDGCRCYLVGVDLRRDRDAVPEIDELAALPLELALQERGFRKIVPNLMGAG